MSNSAKLCIFIFSFFSIHHASVAATADYKQLKRANSQTIKQKVKPSQKININQATAKQIARSFKGIGKKRSESIVAYRTTHGAFKNLDELSKVAGLSPRFVKKNAERLQATFTVKSLLSSKK